MPIQLVPYSEDKDVKKPSYGIPKEIQKEIAEEVESGEVSDILQQRIKERAVGSKDDEYKKRKYEMFKETEGGYSEAMERRKRRERVGDKEEQGDDREKGEDDKEEQPVTNPAPTRRRRKRWDVKPEGKSESALPTGPALTTKIPTGPASLKSATDETASASAADTSTTPNPRTVTTPAPSRWEAEEPSEIDTQQIILSKVPVIEGIPLTDSNLDLLIPDGFKKVPVPSSYKPSSLDMPDFSSFNPSTNTQGYMIPEESSLAVESRTLNPQLIHEVPGLRDIQYFKETDMIVFGKLITTRDVSDGKLSPQDLKERMAMKLVLTVKNGAPYLRKGAMRQLSDRSRSIGPDILFNLILPLLMSRSLEEQERHLLVKVVRRVMFTLDYQVRPYTRKILVVMMPLLIDENRFTRLEGRALISNLAKAAGLAHMISTLRPDIDHPDDYVRNLVARTLAVVASSLGIRSLLPFLKAVCGSKKSWLARHTGVRIVQHIALLIGSGILPYLNGLVSCVLRNIDDDNLSVRTMAATTISSLAEASRPYGFESLEPAIEPLLHGLKQHRGRSLAAFLKALGSLIPLMDEEYSNFYAREVFKVISRELSSPDEHMKSTILRIIEICCSMEIIDKGLILERDFLNDFFDNFWTRRAAMDRRLSRMCVDACYSLSLKAGTRDLVERVLLSLKDDSESFRRMAIECTSRILVAQGSFDISDRSVSRLLDGLLYSLQHQNEGIDKVVLSGFGDIVGSLGIRVKPHLMPIVSSMLYRLKNKNENVREQAADLIAKIAPVLKVCGEEDMLVRLGTILYESLGEVYPDVLGSILGALRGVIGSLTSVEVLNPPISQVLATLTPILRNRHEKVQENAIQLIGDIAERAKDYINHREWMRISFEMLEMLKSSRKSIRVSANKTFGLIASAIGPSDVLVTLLNNLRVQERQLRVCTAVAIGIVAETCLPYTVLPAMMNEYRYPEKNVQNGILKALSFMFEYIGDLGADYIYATTPLLVDALTDSDLVHRQTAATVVKHMALGSVGLGYEDAFLNFLDLIWPNVLESSPHVISRMLEAIEGLRVVLGTGILMNFVLGGLFHPARRVRAAYWKVYNNMYVGSAGSMVPYYPRFESVGGEVEEGMEGGAEVGKDLGVPEMDIWI
ncbi:DEKNAAC101560 [Brettanomyces naardenensis]|uniref:DEKNAAC101560 n=1 Tax=Brettanomyces naardenensis TaxID=13370 RepID=A0A448YIJ5_BRENA|nr:DEKNAAC101560 [Brettanomyces naardenensis]